MSEFRKELEQLVNKHSLENKSNTPDFILAAYLVRCLEAYDLAVKARDAWQGHALAFQVGDHVQYVNWPVEGEDSPVLRIHSKVPDGRWLLEHIPYDGVRIPAPQESLKPAL